MSQVFLVKKNGHCGRCPLCGKDERFISIRDAHEERGDSREFEVSIGLACFMRSVFAQGGFLKINGFDPLSRFEID